MPRLYWARKILWIAVTLLLAGLLAPLVVTVNFWHGSILAALSQGLGRPVRAGAIHLKLFGGPGFEVDNVVVEEDPRFGIEPFARMETLRATLGLGSLWQRRMQFSSLVFVRPSLNVVRNAEGQWNLESLRRVAGSPAAGVDSFTANSASRDKSFHPLPGIQITGGRINFKSENRKKVYVIDALDMKIAPPSSTSEPWRLSFEGRPNRTDFLLNPASRFQGQAEFGPFSPGIRTEAGTLAHLDLSADNALVGDLLKVFTGNDHGVHGSLTFHLHLAGTTSLLRLSGSAEVRDLHRWDRLPPPAASLLHGEIAAILDLEKESLELQSLSIPFSQGLIVVQGDVEQLFHHPQPDLRAELRGVPLGTIVEIAKQFTTRLDTRFIARGSLDGHLQMAGTPDTLKGSLSVSGGLVEEKGTPQSARLSDFKVAFEGTTGRAGPVRINLGKGGELGSSVEWNFGKRGVALHLEGDAVRLDSFLLWAKALGSRWGQANFAYGKLAMRLNVASGEDNQSEITGWAQISDALLNSAAVNQPLRIPGARLQFQPGQVKVKPFSAELGPLELHGGFVAKLPPRESQASASASRFPAIEFDLQASEIDLADLDRLLNPHYRPAAFFRFPGGGEGGASPFFAGLVAQGTLQAGMVSYRGNAIRNFRSSMEFRDRTLQIRSFAGEFAGGTQNGKAIVRFGLGAPAFSLQSRFSKVDLNQLTKASVSWGGFFSGKLSGNLRLAGSGWNHQEILDHLGGSGEATGLNLELHGIDLARGPEPESDPATRIALLSSTFQISQKEVLIKDLRMVPFVRPGPGEPKAPELIVTGAVGFDRALDLLVMEKAGGQPHHWGGTLAEPLVGETAALLHATPHPGTE